jgi:hypothetical protein
MLGETDTDRYMSVKLITSVMVNGLRIPCRIFFDLGEFPGISPRLVDS